MEAAIQLKQSQLLQADRQIRAKDYDAEIAQITREWQSASARLLADQRLPSTEARERLRDLNRTAGCLQRQIEDLIQKEAMDKLVDDDSQRKNELNDQINRLRI